MQQVISIGVLLILFGVNINGEFDSQKYLDMMQDPLQKTQIIFLRKCFRTANKYQINNLLEKIDIAIACGGVENRVGSNATAMDKQCSEAKENIKSCLQPMTTVLNKCLDNEEAYFKEFLVKSITAILNYICENVEPLLQIGDSGKCNQKLEASGVRPPTVCFENFHQLFNTTNAITKDQLCSELQTGRTCMINLYKKICPTENMWTKYVDDNFENLLLATCL